MVTGARIKAITQQTSEPLGNEAELGSSADTLRGNVDAAEYRHVVIGPLVTASGRGASAHHRQRDARY